MAVRQYRQAGRGLRLREEMSAYRAAGGRPVEPERLLFWEVFGTLRWGVLCSVRRQFGSADPTVERAMIARRASETEIDLSVSGGLIMQDIPTPAEILAAAAAFCAPRCFPELSGRTCVQHPRRRQRPGDDDPPARTAPAAQAAERASLVAMLGLEGDLPALNAEFSRRLAAGEVDLDTPGVADHLWATTLAKLAVDQPTYWGYRAALAERAPRQEP